MTILRELLNQISPKECFRAFFCYMPTATGVKPKSGYKTISNGSKPNEIHQALVQLQQSLKNQ